MKERYIELHKAFSSFRKLNLSALYPKLSHGEMVTLKIIAENEDSESSDCVGEGKAHEGGVNISKIVSEMCVAPPAVSRILNSMEDKGLIERKVNKSDRRNTLVELTELGRTANQEAAQAVGNYMTRIMERVDDEEFRQVLAGVNRIYDIAKEELEILKRENK